MLWSSFRLFLAYSILAVASSAMLGFQILQDRTQRLESLSKTLLASTQAAEEAIQATLDNANTVLYQVALDLGRNPQKMRPSFETRLLEYHRPLSAIGGLHLMLVDSSGSIFATTTPNGINKSVNVSDREYFRQLKRAPPEAWTVSSPVYGKLRGYWVIILAKRISDSKGRFLGVAYASIQTDYFAKLREKLSPHEGSLFAVISGNDRRLFYRFPLNDGVLGEPFRDSASFESVLNGSTHIGVSDVISKVDRIERRVAISWIGTYPLLVAYGRETRDFLNEWRALSLNEGLTLLFILGIGYFFLINYLQGARKNAHQQALLANTSKFAALGQMAGGIAHEINNPLAVIMTRAETLRDRADLGEIPSRELNESLDKIIETTDRISKIIHGLKAVSRETGPVEQIFPIQRVLDETLAMARERFRQGGIRLVVEQKASTATVLGNEVQIVQVLLNLLNNAYDAVAELPLKWVKLDVDIRMGSVVIMVTDSGAGIPPELVNRIMEPFFTTKEIGKGTGLGLSISKGIAESHGGTLTYDSKYSHTRFILTLPLAQPEIKATRKLKAA